MQIFSSPRLQSFLENMRELGASISNAVPGPA